MGKPLPNLVNSQLTAAISHPTRMHAMTVLVDREASPRELSQEIGEPINNVSYHVNQLLELGCIELVRTAPTRGGRVVEHFYRATRNTWIGEDEWDQLGPNERHVVTTTIMRAISADVNEAMGTGTFFDPDDNHLSRTPLALDHTGWREVEDLLEQTLKKLLDIRAKVADRVAGGEASDTIPTKVEMMHFRSPAKRGESEGPSRP